MSEKFDQFAIVEVMGHQSYAGRVTEETVGGSSFVRVDVPAVGDKQAFSKLFGASSIYCITPVDEETARAAAGSFNKQPLDEWSARRMLNLPDPQREIGYENDAEWEDTLP